MISRRTCNDLGRYNSRASTLELDGVVELIAWWFGDKGSVLFCVVLIVHTYYSVTLFHITSLLSIELLHLLANASRSVVVVLRHWVQICTLHDSHA